MPTGATAGSRLFPSENSTCRVREALGASSSRYVFVVFIALLALAASPRPGWGQGHESRTDSLVIGLAPEENIFRQVERYTPLVEYLSQKSRIKIRLKVATSYGEVIDNLAASETDGAFLGSFAYILARRKVDIEGLARLEGLDGTSIYHGVLFVRKAGGIRNAREMRGKRFAFVDRATVAGFILPLVYLWDHGIKDYKTYFSETYFTGTHEDAIYDVLNDKADVGAAKNTVFRRLADRDDRIGRDLIVLTRSPDMPETALAVRRSLDPSTKAAIREALLRMDSDPVGKGVLKAFGARRFVPTFDKDYAPLLEYIRPLGLDLQHYNYTSGE